MNILIIANNDEGLYLFRRMLISRLLKNNQVCIALPYGKRVEDLKSLGCRFYETVMERRGMNPIKDVSLFMRYCRIVKQVKPGLVITYTIKPNIYGGIVCRLKKIPYAVNITGLGTAFENRGMLNRLVCVLYRYVLGRAKVVFFENASDRKRMVDLCLVPHEKTKVLAGAGVDLDYFSYEAYPSCGTQTRFLFIGRVMQEKGIDELLYAMKRLRAEGVDCVLAILGSFEEDYALLLREYESDGWLFYHGFQSDVRPFIKDCHCFVLPSWHEGMANTNLECAASGRPVITSNIPGCMEAVIDGKSGFLTEVKNEESLYRKMKQFTALSYEERLQLGLAGRKRMEELFDKQKVVADTVGELI